MMTEAPATTTKGPVIPVRPQPNVYTVLLFIAILAIAISVAVVLWKLTTPMPNGFGLELKHIFQPDAPPPVP